MKTKDKSRALAVSAGSAIPTDRRYSSVIAMMVGEKMSPRIIKGVQKLMARDRLIAREFYHEGKTVRALARKYALKPLWIEDIIRVDGLMVRSSPNAT